MIIITVIINYYETGFSFCSFFKFLKCSSDTFFLNVSTRQECIQRCHADLTAETPIIPGDAHLQAPPPPDPASSFILVSSPQQAKRSYSMEHFRWGKPVGRKRRPVKVYTSNGVEEESAEVFPGEMKKRRELTNELLAAAAVAATAAEKQQEEEEEEEREVFQVVQEAMEEAEQQQQLQLQQQQQQQVLGDSHQKKDGPYKMKHFRWSGPPAAKRYGGFMKSWDERSQRPLLTLFKNVINKDAQQQK